MRLYFSLKKQIKMKIVVVLLFFALFSEQSVVLGQFVIDGDRDVYMLAYFRQRYPTRIEIDSDGRIVEVQLPDPMLLNKLHYAFSHDGRNWTALNDNEPVWDGHARDPFINRGPDGLWRILSTGGGRAGDRAIAGPSCLYITSPDLINFQVEGPLTLMRDVRNDEGALSRNIWAPEWFYDDTTGEYMLFWSSSFEDAGWKKSRLWYCKTLDWNTFTPAQPLFEPPYSVIDGTLIKHDGVYYLFHKEEEFGEITGERRSIRLATSKNLTGPYVNFEGPMNQGQLVPVITEGPSVVKDPVIPGGWLLLYDFCMSNGYGVSTSSDLFNWTIEKNVSFPPDSRHGCVVILKPEEARKILQTFSK